MKNLFDLSQDSARKALLLTRDLVEERTGNYFGDSKLEMLADKLSVRAAELGHLSFLDYYYYLRYDPENEAEWLLLRSVLTVKETYFQREAEAFRAVTEQLVPELARLRPGPVRIWHAGCATGEEPLSMAIALAEAGHLISPGCQILATDLDPQAVAQAASGRYRERSFRRMSERLWQRYFRPQPGGEWAALPELLANIQYRTLNLLDEEAMLALPRFDVIFCRNVMIYFRPPTVEHLARHFYRLLTAPGTLFLSATESLLRYPISFQFRDLAGVIAYRKEGEDS